MTEGTTMTAEREAIVQIAEGLTEPQRNYMINACEPCLWEDHRLWMNVTSPEMMSYLVRSGCHRALDHDLMIMALSGIGLAVRDHLKESTHE